MGLFKRGTPEDQFADEVLRAVRASGKVTEAWFDKEAFAVRYRRPGSIDGAWLFLHNTFQESAKADRQHRAAIVHNLVSTIGEESVADIGWDEVRSRLRPVLRGVSFGLGAPSGAKPMLSRPALPYLSEKVVIDMPTSMAYVTLDQVSTWGVPIEEVFAAARANLAGTAARLGEGDPADGPVVLRYIDDGDAYFSSMLLVDGFLASQAPKVGGRPVAFVPDVRTLTVLADHPPAVAKFLEMVDADFREAPRSLSPVAYTVDSRGAVVPYSAAEPGELANWIHRSEVMLAAGEYSAQKAALEARYEAEGTDIFVASVLVAKRPDESVFSIAVWSDDCDTLLPEADLVDLRRDDESLIVPWDVVVTEVGLVPAPGLDPVRCRVTTWPPEPVLDRLRAQAVTP